MGVINMAVRVMLISFLLPLIFHGVSDACRFGSGDNCAFPCNCYNGGTCGTDTGSCLSGCESGQPPGRGYDWRGPGCQIGNVAYNKDTNQTGAWGSLYSLYGVDGNIGSPSTEESYCAHPNNTGSQPAEWTVDLGDKYTVYNVIIFNAHTPGGSKRLTKFDLWVEETSARRELCAYYNDPAPVASASLTIQCGGGSGYVGRYVHLRRREGAEEVHLITLCEVIVWGNKYIDCSDCPSGTSCNNIIGCAQCPAGKQLPDCKQACQAGYYGVNCAESCGQCKQVADCQATDGHCQNGCQLWWAGDTCKVEIVKPGCCQGDEGLDPVEDSAITSSSVTISWTQETSVPQGYDSHYGYIINYRIDGQVNQNFTSITHDSSQTRLTITVTGLEENTLYFLKITPYRKSGGQEDPGWAYGEARASTKCSVLVKPDITEIIKQDQGNPSFTVYYQLPEYTNNGCFDGVVLQYNLFSASLWENKTISHTPATGSATVNNLLEDGYYVRILVYNKDAKTYSDQQNVVFKGTPPTTTPPSTSPITTSITNLGEDIAESNQQKSGLSNTELIIIAVVVVVVVVVTGVVVIIVVRHVYRYRRESTNPGGPTVSYVNQAVPVAVVQPEDMKSESEYEDVGVTSTDVEIKETAYQHLHGQSHNDYENSFTSGPYAELR